MSGIAGLISLDGAPVLRPRLEQMAKAAESLGPDGQHIWSSGGAGLVYLKLATTPESVDEHQPIVDKEANLVAVFDGRLDNRAELLAELNTTSSPLQSSGDGALALEMFKRMGTRCPERFAGDYALAIWDIRERRLFCARSLLGWRPFLWWCNGSTFGFATEVKQLFAGGGIERAVNEPMWGEILSLRITHIEDTIWKGIYRLQPGGALSVHGGRPRTWRWHRPPPPETRLQTEEAYVERFRDLFDQSIKACVRSTTPVISQLSGGLDSSSIVCRAADLYRAGEIAAPVQSISAVFPGRPHDESDWIAMVATKTGIEPKLFQPMPYDWNRAVSWTRDTLGLPIRPNAHLMDSIAAQVPGLGSRVMLTGEGGDDWLNGSISHWPDLLRRGQFIRLLHEGLILNTDDRPWLRVPKLAAYSVGPWIQRYVKGSAIYRSVSGTLAPPWIRPEWARKIGLNERLRQVHVIADLDGLAQQQRYQRFLSLRHHVTYDGVLSSMARNGIEIRHPFHDRRLTEFVLGLPGHLLRQRGLKKYILRQAMKGVLPDPIRNRKTKARFFLPMLGGIEEFLATKPVSEWLCVREGWVDGTELHSILVENRSHDGQMALLKKARPLGPVWFAVALDIWMTHAFSAPV